MQSSDQLTSCTLKAKTPRTNPQRKAIPVSQLLKFSLSHAENQLIFITLAQISQ